MRLKHVSSINRGPQYKLLAWQLSESDKKTVSDKMADRPEESCEGTSTGQDLAARPVSGGSKESKGSDRTIGDAVSKLTVKALKEFRLSDPSDVDTTVTGGESIPGINMAQDVTNIDLAAPPGQTLLSSEQDDLGEMGDDIDDAGDDEDDLLEGGSGESDEESDGESEMVVLDPDHVRIAFLLKMKQRLFELDRVS